MSAFSDFRESFRYLFADIIGERDGSIPYLPPALPESVVPVASDAIHLLIEYQGTGYAKLYVERLLAQLQDGLIFANLIETDQLYGHRKDARGFARGHEGCERRRRQRGNCKASGDLQAERGPSAALRLWNNVAREQEFPAVPITETAKIGR